MASASICDLCGNALFLKLFPLVTESITAGIKILVGHRTETGCDCARLAGKQIRPGAMPLVMGQRRVGTNFSSVTEVEIGEWT